MKFLVSLLALICSAWVSAQPVAQEGEPPFQNEVRPDGTRSKFYDQIFQLEPRTLDEIDLTLAQKYWLLGPDGGTVSGGTVEMGCPISDKGIVVVRRCQATFPRGMDRQTFLQLERLARAAALSPRFPAFPAYRAIKEPEDKSWRVDREVRFQLTAPGFAAPTFDGMTGEVVSVSNFPDLVSSVDGKFLSNYYPSRALRREIEGVQTLECEVQADLSVICLARHFTDSQYANSFARVARRLFDGQLAPKTLPDGRPSAGKSFMLQINWTIN